MWDLIISVPDHCLSFYFSNCHTVERFHHYSKSRERWTSLSKFPSSETTKDIEI